METGAWDRRSCCSSLSLPSSLDRKPPPTSSRRRSPRRPPRIVAAGEKKTEIRVCVNRACSRMGSREILATLSDISPPDVAVKSCGCLGRCGAGPNLVVLPGGAIIGHCRTPAKAAELLEEICASKRGSSREGFDPRKNLEALTLRKKAEVELQDRGNPSKAEAILSQAIDLKPSGGLHLIYKTRSEVRLTMGNSEGAMEDADEALKIYPRFHLGYICRGDAYMAMGEWAKAESAYSKAMEIDPSIRRSKWFKDRVTKLQEKMASADNPS